MNDLERLLIEHQCTRLFHEFIREKQYGDLLKAARYFVDDARIFLKNRGQTLDGRKEIDEHYGRLRDETLAGRVLARYFLSALVVDVKDSNHASSHVDVMGIRRFWDVSQGPCPTIAPEIFCWEHEYVRTPDGWKFCHQVTTPKSFESPEAQIAEFIELDAHETRR